MRTTIAFLIALLAMGSARIVSALTITVGPSGCNTMSLQSAINTLASSSDSSHTIKLKSGTIGIPDGVTMNIPASDVFMTGGFSNCSDSAPTVGQRTTLDATGGGSGTAISIDAGNRSLQQWIRLDAVTVRGGNSETGPLANPEGGGLEIRGHARIYLNNDSRIVDNNSGKGGGIFLNGASSTRRAELQIRDGSSVSDNFASTLGGGIYCENHGTTTLMRGNVSFNDAMDGGGLFLDRGCRLASLAGGSSALKSIDNNRALRVGSSGGYGGGINILSDGSTGNPVSLTGEAGNPILLLNNSATVGGGLYAFNPTSSAVNLSFANTVWYGHRADYGAAMTLEGGISALVEALPSCTYSFFGRPGCSAFDDNIATSDAGAIAAYPGSSTAPKNLTINRTRFENNEGSPALIHLYYNGDNALTMEGSVIRNNRSVVYGGQAQHPLSRTLIAVTGLEPQSIRYSTILENDTDWIVTSYSPGGATSGSPMSMLGSIVWAPGTQVWRLYNNSATTFAFGGCFLTHSNAGLPPSVTVANPQLQADLTPGSTSPALDICDTFFGTPQADFLGQARGYDQATVPDLYGPYDLGAVERRTTANDTIFENGFETP